MRIDVVDNGGQWTHREWRVLRYLGVETHIIPNTTPLEEIRADALVLSGGAPRIVEELPKLGNTGEYIDKLDIPILGICVSHQFIAVHHGGDAGPADIPEYGKVICYVDEANELFLGLPKSFVAWESHNDEIKLLPKDFIVLAHSDTCRYQAIKHRKRALYGTQFHPEVEQTEGGSQIFENFISVCKR